MTELYAAIEQLNTHYGLEIDLSHVEQIYGSDMLDAMASMVEEVVANIEYLVELGFDENTTDVCNRYGPVLVEDRYYFREKVDKLFADLGHDAIEQLAEDMSHWEKMM